MQPLMHDCIIARGSRQSTVINCPSSGFEFPEFRSQPMELKKQRSPVYDSLKRGPVALEELRGLIKYRDLIYQLVRRDIVSRYKRSALGIAWTMLNPLGMMVILSVVFSQLFRAVDGIPGLRAEWSGGLEFLLPDHVGSHDPDGLG